MLGGGLGVQAIWSAVLGVSFRLRKVIHGAARVVGTLGICRGCRTFIPEIEKHFGLGREFWNLDPDERQLICAIPLLDMELELGLVIRRYKAQIAAVVVCRKKIEIPGMQTDQHRYISNLA